ncbi:unnamed protein product [Rotaria socialis]
MKCPFLFLKSSSKINHQPTPDSTTKEALIIDPVIDTVERDAKLIQQFGLNLRHAVNTHVHADHITGTDIYLKDGEFIKIGESGKTPLALECRATPGHTNGETNMFSVLEEKTLNPRLTKSHEECIQIMANLNLSYPKQIDKVLPANLLCGLQGNV